jgi:aryl sulfotransferase
MDSTAWNDFRFRDSDIIIATYPKSGTSWGQQIIAQLLFHGAEGVKVSNHSFFYGRWFSENGYPTVSLWENVRSWWMSRELSNVKLVHFNDLKADLAGTIRSMAAFLKIQINERAFPRIVEHCTLDYMKAHAELVTPSSGNMWRGGAKTFINKGSNNRWRDTLSAAEIMAYEARAIAELGPECAKWLAHGGGA